MRHELQSITGVISNGPVTHLLYELMKDLPKDESLVLLEPLADSDLIKQIKKGRELINASNAHTNIHSSEKRDNGPSFEEWLSDKRFL